MGDVTIKKVTKYYNLLIGQMITYFNHSSRNCWYFWQKGNALIKYVLVIRFEGNEITFTKQDMMELTQFLLYINHKYKVQELPAMAIYIVKQYFRMLEKPMLLVH